MPTIAKIARSFPEADKGIYETHCRNIYREKLLTHSLINTMWYNRQQQERLRHTVQRKNTQVSSTSAFLNPIRVILCFLLMFSFSLSKNMGNTVDYRRLHTVVGFYLYKFDKPICVVRYTSVALLIQSPDLTIIYNNVYYFYLYLITNSEIGWISLDTMWSRWGLGLSLCGLELH